MFHIQYTVLMSVIFSLIMEWGLVKAKLQILIILLANGNSLICNIPSVALTGVSHSTLPPITLVHILNVHLQDALSD